MADLERFKAGFLEIFKKIDWVILASILALMVFGLVTMSTLDAGDNIFWKQIILISIAVISFIVFSLN
jgi:cell division protein FtsW (lipid II flippase)